jgi:hypothetical protein
MYLFFVRKYQRCKWKNKIRRYQHTLKISKYVVCSEYYGVQGKFLKTTKDSIVKKKKESLTVSGLEEVIKENLEKEKLHKHK